jgi:hypothetical protein
MQSEINSKGWDTLTSSLLKNTSIPSRPSQTALLRWQITRVATTTRAICRLARRPVMTNLETAVSQQTAKLGVGPPTVRRKRRMRRRSALQASREALPAAAVQNDRWTMDLLSDSLKVSYVLRNRRVTPTLSPTRFTSPYWACENPITTPPKFGASLISGAVTA